MHLPDSVSHPRSFAARQSSASRPGRSWSRRPAQLRAWGNRRVLPRPHHQHPGLNPVGPGDVLEPISCTAPAYAEHPPRCSAGWMRESPEGRWVLFSADSPPDKPGRKRQPPSCVPSLTKPACAILCHTLQRLSGRGRW